MNRTCSNNISSGASDNAFTVGRRRRGGEEEEEEGKGGKGGKGGKEYIHTIKGGC